MATISFGSSLSPTPTVLRKRGHDGGESDAKKIASSSIFNVILFAESGHGNSIFVSSKSFDQPCFLRLADRVFQAVPKDFVSPGCVAMNPSQRKEISSGIFAQSEVVATIFHETMAPLLSTLPVSIRIVQRYSGTDLVFEDGDTKVSISRKPMYSLHDLEALFHRTFDSHIVSSGQELTFEAEGVVFAAAVGILPSSKELSRFGKIENTTKLDLRYPLSEMIIYKERKEFDNALTEFDVRFIGNPTDHPFEDCSIVLENEFYEIANFLCEGRTLVLGETFRLNYKGYEFELTLKFIDDIEAPASYLKPQFDCAYSIEEVGDVEIYSASPLIKLAKGAPFSAKEVELEVIRHVEDQGESKQINHFHVNVEKLIKEILSQKKQRVEGEVCKISFSDENYIIRFNRFKGSPLTPFAEVVSETTPYIIDPFSAITVKTTSKKLVLIQDDTNHEIKTVTLKVMLQESKHSLFSLMQKEPADAEKIEELELEELVRKAKKPLLKNEIMEMVTSSGLKIIIQVSSLTLKKEPDEIKLSYQHLGVIKKNTKIIFERECEDIQLIPKVQKEQDNHSLDDIKLIIGGINRELEEITRAIVHSRGKLSSEAKRRGIEPISGLLLYGPPGTGKTTIAKNLARSLGCEKKNVNLISGTQIFNKFLGESERLVRELFVPAQRDFEKYGESSPLHVLAIDEIDALLPNRSHIQDSEARGSIVNQFLTAFDGFEQRTNLLVIGITNRPEALDPAVKRHKRFGLKVEIPLPDLKGRREIFDIYTKKMREENLLGSDVDLDQLAHLTPQFSGADIQGLVTAACSFSMHRLSQLDLPKEELATRPEGLTTMKDFTDALSLKR